MAVNEIFIKRQKATKSEWVHKQNRVYLDCQEL